jgi:hypothetical protein
VRRFTVAVNEDRLDDARALLHPDSSIEAAEVDDIPDPTLTLVGSGDAEATVDVATDSIEVHVILRRREGEWLVYGSE